MHPMKKYPPGSDKAVKAGCSCPRMDNCRGRGRFGDGRRCGWFVREDCSLHGKPPDLTTGSDDL